MNSERITNGFWHLLLVRAPAPRQRGPNTIQHRAPRIRAVTPWGVIIPNLLQWAVRPIANHTKQGAQPLAKD